MAPPTIGLERLNILVLKFALSPQHVKAFVKNHKNDANDALTIFEAANRPGMHFVPVKNLYQQDLSVLHNVRQSLVQKRVAISNQIRGLAAEYGIIFPQRSAALRQSLHEALEDADNELTMIARRVLKQLYEDWLKLIQQTEEIEETLKSLSSQTAQWQQLQSIPGIGPLIASAMVAYIGDGKQFNNGRQMAAWLGLVPRQASSGGKTQLGKITKNGNRYLRGILIHGARAAIQRRTLPIIYTSICQVKSGSISFSCLTYASI
ncbi:IS110 family transposase [Xenorhabdus budapestensis]|uniref:IS110 family transposase n=2 Tax=Xenorhabdus budapestensis TaxID=290110 RepID=A0ABX7VLB0_XENBU|nr:IS110 family transposase [Xenorhabdus budapestensis]QTL41230.1 IS110 family transposase [Xenorhabdus budapestensis]